MKAKLLRWTNLREVLNVIFPCPEHELRLVRLASCLPAGGDGSRLFSSVEAQRTLANDPRYAETPSSGGGRKGTRAQRRQPVGEDIPNRWHAGGKQLNGIRRRILVDTLDPVLVVVVHAANIQDRDGAKLVFAKARNVGPLLSMEHVWANGGYAGKPSARVLEIVKRNDDVKGFKLLTKLWMVKRTFSWLSNYRNLCKHPEHWNWTGEVMIHPMVRHLVK